MSSALIFDALEVPRHQPRFSLEHLVVPDLESSETSQDLSSSREVWPSAKS